MVRHWRVTISSFNMIRAWWLSTSTWRRPLFPMVLTIMIHGRISPKGEMMQSILRASPWALHHHHKHEEYQLQEHTRVSPKPRLTPSSSSSTQIHSRVILYLKWKRHAFLGTSKIVTRKHGGITKFAGDPRRRRRKKDA